MSKNKQSIFCGTATALITPFRDGKIDFKALGKLIDRQLNQSIDALVVSGTTGESATLSPDEITELVRFAAEKIEGRVPLIAGTGCNNTARAVELSKKADEAGADALLVVTPYYNKATKRGLIESYTKIASCTKKPIIIYNVPTRTCVNISLETYEELSKIENIVAVKEANPDIVATAELIDRCGNDFDIYTGNDNEILPVLALGGTGVVSVVSNLIPSAIHNMCRMYFEGNTSEAKRIYFKYLPLMQAMFKEVNPIPVKTALSMLGLCKDEFRLPLCSMQDNERSKLKEIIEKYEDELLI